jgi:hypothetical protein
MNTIADLLISTDLDVASANAELDVHLGTLDMTCTVLSRKSTSSGCVDAAVVQDDYCAVLCMWSGHV